MIKVRLLGLILLLINAVAFSQKEKAITLNYNEFIELVTLNHPVAKQAELKIEYGDAYLQKSRGFFDPKVFSELSQKYFNENQYYSNTNTGLKIPTWYGLEFGGGYEQNQGQYLNPQNNTPNAGLWYAGVSLSLGQGLFIDERRSELKKAQIYLKGTQAERQLLYNELIYEAGKFYWEWFNSYNALLVYEDALMFANQRFEAVKQGAFLGDKSLIDTVEASIQVQNRLLNIQQAQLNYKNATAMLSVYLWKDGIMPLEIAEGTIPMVVNEVENKTVTGKIFLQMDSIQQNHPALVQYQYKMEQLVIEKKLKQEMIKPKLNLKYNAITQPVGNDAFNQYNLNNYKWGLEFSMPLFLRKERGDLKLAKLKIDETQLIYDTKIASLTYKAKASINELETSYNQAKLYAQTVSDYLRLLNGEKQKFDVGESSLFMINSRELGYINTQLKLIELIAKNQKAKLATDYALGLLSTN
jgi:outer membrane protein TolC